jgi:hypothetical protein
MQFHDLIIFLDVLIVCIGIVNATNLEGFQMVGPFHDEDERVKAFYERGFSWPPEP